MALIGKNCLIGAHASATRPFHHSDTPTTPFPVSDSIVKERMLAHKRKYPKFAWVVPPFRTQTATITSA